jgi:glycosyltransferase involved in cell wall biosynthesis
MPDLAAKILKALNQPAWANQLGNQSRAIAIRDLSWDRSARQIEALYAEATQRRAQGRTVQS